MLRGRRAGGAVRGGALGLAGWSRWGVLLTGCSGVGLGGGGRGCFDSWIWKLRGRLFLNVFEGLVGVTVCYTFVSRLL